MMKVDARDIKSAADIKPVRRTDHTFIAKNKYLASRNRIGPTGRGTTDLNVALPKSPSVLEGIRVGNVVVEKDTRVLHFSVELEPLFGLDSYVDAQAVQQVKIACFRETRTFRTLRASTIFTANVKPARQNLVEFLDREQPR